MVNSVKKPFIGSYEGEPNKHSYGASNISNEWNCGELPFFLLDCFEHPLRPPVPWEFLWTESVLNGEVFWRVGRNQGLCVSTL